MFDLTPFPLSACDDILNCEMINLAALRCQVSRSCHEEVHKITSARQLMSVLQNPVQWIGNVHDSGNGDHSSIAFESLLLLLLHCSAHFGNTRL